MRSAGTARRTRTGYIPHTDVLWITVIALITACLYVVTARPDVGGPEDSPKFQFLGFVLGTAHPPGYPLYVLLTHLFVKLPVGTSRSGQTCSPV